MKENIQHPNHADDYAFIKRKEFLKRYRRIVARANRLHVKLNDLRDRMDQLGAQVITDMPRGGQSKTTADYIAEIDETERRIAALSKQAWSVRGEIVTVIDQLDDVRQCEILERFFLDDEPLHIIADDLGYTERHTIRLYSDAVRKIHID